MMDGGVFREARHYGDYRPGRGNVTHGSPGAPQTYERCPFEKAKQVTIKLNQGFFMEVNRERTDRALRVSPGYTSSICYTLYTLIVTSIAMAECYGCCKASAFNFIQLTHVWI